MLRTPRTSHRLAILITVAISLNIGGGAVTQARGRPGGASRLAARLDGGASWFAARLAQAGSGPAGILSLRAPLSGSLTSRAVGALGAQPTRTLGTLPKVLAGTNEQDAAFDPPTQTLYVANAGDNTLSVIDARTCNARQTAGCRQTAPTVAAGRAPVFVAIDDITHTLYVADQNSKTVLVIDAATCNAVDTSGCGETHATVTVGAGPSGIAVDPVTDTIYVTDSGYAFNGSGHTVAVINGATCNASDTAGCGQHTPRVPVGQVPFNAAFDAANRTVYVTDLLDNTVSMINAATCNATARSGCHQTAPTVAVGTAPVPVAIDQASNTVYVGNDGEPTVSLIDGSTCNATNTSGCGHTPVTLSVPGGSDGLAVDQATRTLFVANNGPGPNPAHDATVSVVNAATCNAKHTSGCDQRAPLALVGGSPGGNTVDEATDTLYVATSDNAVSVVNGATCNQTNQTGCGQPTPATVAGPDTFSIALNPATHTVYTGDSGGNEGGQYAISVLDAATCNPVVRTGCRPDPPSISTPFNPYGVAVDSATDTLYVANLADASGHSPNTVSVIDGATCNASVTTGCASAPSTVAVGSYPAGLAVNERTDTIYVANAGGNTVSVIDGATCNAAYTTGCSQTPAAVPIGRFPQAVAVNQATDTIYVLDPGTPSTVSVIDGATCNSSVSTGCAATPPSVTVGNGTVVEALAVDPITDTVYVVNTDDNTVSVIDGATCNRQVTSGCAQTPPVVHVGRQFFGSVAVDPTTDLIYVSNYLDDTVSVIDGARCNATITWGCHLAPPTVPAGGNPAGLVVNAADHTLYADDNGFGGVSFFHFTAPGRPTAVTASVGRGDVQLTWQAPADGGLPIIYRVIPSPACPDCQGLGTPPTSGEPSTTVSGLTPGQSYTFTVRASDAAGSGPPSAPSDPFIP